MGDPLAALNFYTDYPSEGMESCTSTFNELVRVERLVRKGPGVGVEREKDP